ncbi:hypothetical protein [Neptuniibacter marinus]|uniref:hypothetical protein n=1 Tax=Neptuniibacter marinus TaxID=1806670 RepID=UPI00082FE709|nr:hypothetical protein [Neptuniibacter marinus]
MPRRSIGRELSDVPFGEMITGMGMAIAEAQYAMDESGLRLAQMMSGEYEVTEVDPITGATSVTKKESLVHFDGQKMSLIELGFTPTFYQFTDTTIEIKISISFTEQSEFERKSSSKSVSATATGFIIGAHAKVRTTSVSARYANKYNYSAEGSSLMRSRIMPTPPPAVLEERIRAIVERNQPDSE